MASISRQQKKKTLALCFFKHQYHTFLFWTIPQSMKSPLSYATIQRGKQYIRTHTHIYGDHDLIVYLYLQNWNFLVRIFRNTNFEVKNINFCWCSHRVLFLDYFISFLAVAHFLVLCLLLQLIYLVFVLIKMSKQIVCCCCRLTTEKGRWF